MAHSIGTDADSHSNADLYQKVVLFLSHWILTLIGHVDEDAESFFDSHDQILPECRIITSNVFSRCNAVSTCVS
jgi:hypothetical protein